MAGPAIGRAAARISFPDRPQLVARPLAPAAEPRPGSRPADDEPAALEGEAAGPGERFEQQQRLSHLAAALAELPPRRREAFVLHKFDGLSQVEVAERMGISLSMVEKHIASALLHCKRRLGQGGEG